MRIDNLSEEKIRLLRDLIEYHVASYDDVDSKRKEALTLLDNLRSNPTYITTRGFSEMMRDIAKQCHDIIDPNPYLVTSSILVNNYNLIEILGSYDPKFIKELIRSIDWHWPFEAPRGDNFYISNDSKSTERISYEGNFVV